MIIDKNKLVYVIVWFFAQILFCCDTLLGAEQGSCDVLLLDSYLSGYKWSDTLISEIQDGFASGLGNKAYAVDIERMDLRVSYDSSYQRLLAESLQNKYKSMSFDLVISVSPAESVFAHNYLANNLLKDVIAIDYGADFGLPAVGKIADVTKYIPHYEIDTQVAVIKQIIPQVEEIVVVAGANQGGYVREFEEYIASQSGSSIKFRIISGAEYNTRQIYSLLGDAGVKRAIIYAGWSGGIENNFVDTYQVCRDLVAKSSGPVFAISSDYMGEGVVGGYMISVRAVASMIVDLALAKLGYVDKEIKSEQYEICRNVFDLDVLLKWKIPVSVVPANSEVIDSSRQSGSHDEGGSLSDTLTPQEKLWLLENPTATVAMLVRPPLVMPGDKPEGFAIDYIKLLAEKAGVALEYDSSYRNIEDCLNAVSNGFGPDIIVAMEQTKKRSEYLLFSDSWMSMYYTLFVQRDKIDASFTDLSSLADKVIAVERGSSICNILAREHKYITLLECDNAISALQAVGDGKAFGWIGDQTTGLYCIREYGINNVSVSLTFHELGRHDLSFAVRKDKGLLFSILNKQMAKLTVAEVNKLRARYTDNDNYRMGINVVLVIKIALVAIVIAIGIISILIIKVRLVGSAIWKNEEKLKVAFESIGDAVVVTGWDGILVRINNEAEKLTGWTRAEMIGKPFINIFDLVDSDTMKTIDSPVDTVIKNGNEIVDNTAALIARDGRRYYISYSASPVKTDESGCVGVVVIFRDITSEYETTRKMRQAEKERQTIFDNITIGVCFYDKFFYPVSYNRQMEIFRGDVIDKRVSQKEVYAESGYESLPREIHKFNIYKGGNDQSKGYELEVTALPVMDESGPIGILEMVVDVTEYRQLQKELESAYNELSQYSGSLEQQIKLRTFELQDRNDQLNMALEELRLAQSQLVLTEKMAALGQLVSGISQELNTPFDIMSSSVNIIRSSMGHLIHNVAKVDEYFNGENAQLVHDLLKHGVAHRKSGVTLSTSESRAIRSKIRAEMQEHGITEYADYMASMLAGLGVEACWLNYLPILKQHNVLDVLHEITGVVNISGSCASVLKAVSDASLIVKALKNYVHKSSHGDRCEIVETVIDVVAGIKTVLVLFNSRIKKDIKLELDLQDVPAVRGVSDELNQVWTNIIQNAIQAMKSGGTLSIATRTVDTGANIIIRDNGCGMSDEVKSRIFEPLFTTTPGQSSGMGMEIVRRIIVDNMRGRISVESQENIGTAVSVWLPGITQ